jgi:hypothetical protein
MRNFIPLLMVMVEVVALYGHGSSAIFQMAS